MVNDPDSGTNGRSTFRLSGLGSERFSVKTRSDKVAVISVAGDLDRERTASYQLVIKATDGVDGDQKRFSASTKLSISVLDVNDNAPVFENLKNFTVREEEAAGVVGVVKVTDNDSGENGRVTFAMTGGLGYFSINKTDGTITTTRTIDAETFDSFKLDIIASDSGTPSKTATGSVIIAVEDINDNDPVILDLRDVIFDENKPCSSPVVTVSASDADRSQSVVLSTTNKNFRIDQSGKLWCKVPLDYETQKSYNVTVRATDDGKPSRSTERTVVVNVNDVNDNAPQFSALDYAVNISTAELQKSKPLIVIDATDRDSGPGGQIVFSLSDTALFYVESINNVGVVRVKSDIGRIGKYTIDITATDRGTPSLSNQTTITITVAGAREVVQFDNNEFNFTVVEGSRDFEARLGQVSAKYDSNTIGVKYELPVSQLFSINSDSGEVFCKTELDREDTARYFVVVRVYSTVDQKDGDVALVNIIVVNIVW